MAWTGAQVLAWLDQVEPQADARSHFEWLEMVPSASSQAIQNAYHAVARTRHPDLMRTTLKARDLDRLVRMYARIASAYAALRPPDAAARYLRERRDSTRPGSATAPAGTPALNPTPHGGTPSLRATPPTGIAALVATPALPGTASPPAATAAEPAPAGPDVDPAQAMNARAFALYRRAERALLTGDRTTALLQIRMAIAADPRSPFLRAALAELNDKR